MTGFEEFRLSACGCGLAAKLLPRRNRMRGSGITHLGIASLPLLMPIPNCLVVEVQLPRQLSNVDPGLAYGIPHSSFSSIGLSYHLLGRNAGFDILHFLYAAVGFFGWLVIMRARARLGHCDNRHSPTSHPHRCPGEPAQAARPTPWASFARNEYMKKNILKTY